MSQHFLVSAKSNAPCAGEAQQRRGACRSVWRQSGGQFALSLRDGYSPPKYARQFRSRRTVRHSGFRSDGLQFVRLQLRPKAGQHSLVIRLSRKTVCLCCNCFRAQITLDTISRTATDLPVALIRRRQFACDVGQIRSISPRIPCPPGGAYRDRHGRWARDAMAVGLRTRRMRFLADDKAAWS